MWLALAAVLLLRPQTRRTGWMLLGALALETVCCNLLLKPLVARPRPFALEPGVQLLIAPPGDFSFPSGHTAAGFAAVSALYFGKSRLWLPALAAAVLIAFFPAVFVRPLPHRRAGRRGLGRRLRLGRAGGRQTDAAARRVSAHNTNPTADHRKGAANRLRLFGSQLRRRGRHSNWL